MDYIEVEMYMHVILSIPEKEYFLPAEAKEELEDYLREMVEINGHKIHAVSCLPDHSHLLVSWNPEVSVDGVIQEIKQLAKHYILYKNWKPAFEWNEDYATFSASSGEVDELVRYIDGQREYHKDISFKDEFAALLKEHEFDYTDEDLDNFCG